MWKNIRTVYIGIYRYILTKMYATSKCVMKREMYETNNQALSL